MTNRYRMLRVFAVTAAFLAAVATAAAAQDVKTVVARGAFDDVKFEVSNAIVAKGLAIESEGNIGRMLERTAADVGATKTVYKNAVYFAFCSARYSRMIMEADPSGAAFCPFTVFLYETAAKPGEVIVGYRKLGATTNPAMSKAFAEVEALLDGIVAAAAK